MYKCKNRLTDKECAVKIMDKLNLREEDLVRIKYEVDILRNLNHPNILQLYEVYENESSIYLVTEFCDGVELFEIVNTN